MAYKEMVEAMDQGVGRILDTVRRLGLEEHTFIFFCSDNGACAEGSNGALRGFKGSVWEGGHRVPAIAYWPGHIAPGSVTQTTALTMDLLPTIAALAGASLPWGRAIDGVDLGPVLFQAKDLPERSLFWSFAGQKAVRKENWKCVFGKRAKTPDADEKPPLLFNLENDLSESKDLAKKFPRRVEHLISEHVNWERKVTAGVNYRT